mgnify:CR=1 FL=1
MELPINQILQGDCLEVMKTFPDKSIDLILTDLPYGIYSDKKVTGFAKKRIDWGLGNWDIKVGKNYFDEMFRISKNQVIFGLQYYIDCLLPTKEVWVWDKKTGNNFFADGELAWTSYSGTLRIFRHQWCGAFKDSERKEKSQHPTQKPVELMKWCMRNTKENDIILDPFLGSGTTAVAAKQLGRKYIGIEISEKYCQIARDRLRQEVLFRELYI